MTIRPRVCFVIPSLAPGGTERQLLYLLEGLQGTHQCTVVCTREAGSWADAARRVGAELHELKTRGGWDPRIARRLRKVLDANTPDILHTFLFGFDLAVNRVARAAHVPVVISSRRELAAWMKARHIRLQRSGNALVDCIVANSNAVAQFAAEQEKTDPGRFRVIHNGIDADALSATVRQVEIPLPENAPIVGMVANFSPVKDHALFAAAAARLASARADVHFLLVGSGGLMSNTERTVQKLGLQSRFTFTSTTNDCASLITRMDVCVCTSLREGFPNSMLEAMALKRPVVAAAVGGIPELIEDAVCGVLVQSREPGDFAAAISRVLDDEPFAASLAENAHARVRDRFSIEKMVTAYRDLYSELLANSRNAMKTVCAASAE